MTRSNPLRSLGDLGQFLSAETRSELDRTDPTVPVAPSAPEETPAPVAPPAFTLHVTYNISATRIVRQFLVDNVLTHYQRADKPTLNGTLSKIDLDLPDINTVKTIVALINDARVPTLKYFLESSTPPAAEPVAAETPAPVEEPAPVDHITPEDMAEAEYEDLNARAVDPTPAVDEYQGRRVLPIIEPVLDPYASFDPFAPTSILHTATGQVFATYPTLAEARHAYDSSQSPRKAEFELRQPIIIAPVADFDTPEPETTPDVDGPYTLMMLDGDSWDTIAEFDTAAAATAWIAENVAEGQFDPTEWTLYNAHDAECALGEVYPITPDYVESLGASVPVAQDDLAPVELEPVHADPLDLLTPATLPEPATVEPVDVAPLEDRSNRIAKIEHITTFYRLLNLDVRNDLHTLSDTALDDLLFALESNNGGSLEAAAVIAAVEENYRKFIGSDTLRLKMQAMDVMGTAYFKQVQKIAAAVGDVTIAGMKGTAYHDQLKAMVSHLSILNDSVMHLGELLGLRIPVDGLSGAHGDIAVAEGLPFNPKVCMYVLEVFRSNVHNLQTKTKVTQEDLRRANTAKAEAESALRRFRDDMQTTLEAMRARETYLTGLLANNKDTYWMLRSPSGKYLAKIDPTQPIRSAQDLHLSTDANDAIRFQSAGRAKATVERLAATQRFRKVTLTLRRVTEVEEG